MENYKFKVDLKGIIRLLSDNLYSSEDVFLREVLQNAVDAIKARKKAEPDFKEGEIRITSINENKERKIIIEDNGVGLTEEEMHSFLSVIGFSSKSAEEGRKTFIGQFGIGLLSCFLVAEKIKVVSRSIREEKTYQWLGHSDGTYQVQEEPEEREPGTTVYLTLKGSMYKKYKEAKILELLSAYAFLLQYPVIYQNEDGEQRVNDAYIPWRQSFCTKETIMEFGKNVFEEEFFDVISLNGENVKGYAFVSLSPMTPTSTQEHKIFLKNMFVTDNEKDLIPQWAFFTKCIVNTENLTPTASRESFAKDYQLMKAKNEIEKSIFDYFVSLSQYDAEKLKQITRIHNLAIKSLAAEQEEIFRLFFPFLTFSTNKGTMAGFQIVEAAKKMPVYYCVDVEDFGRISPLIKNSGGLLVNGGYVYDCHLIEQAEKIYKGVKFTIFEEALYEDLLETPAAKIVSEMESLMGCAKEILNACNCGVSLKAFSPKELPALYVPGEDLFLGKTMSSSSFSTFFEGFSFEEQEEHSTKLYINSNNALIKKIAKLTDQEKMKTILQILYVQAMMTGHYTLGEQEMNLLENGIGRLIEYGL